jgi:hypothetical protein
MKKIIIILLFTLFSYTSASCIVEYERVRCVDIESRLFCFNAINEYITSTKNLHTLLTNNKISNTSKLIQAINKHIPDVNCNINAMCICSLSSKDNCLSFSKSICQNNNLVNLCMSLKNNNTISQFKNNIINELNIYNQNWLIDYVNDYSINIDCINDKDNLNFAISLYTNWYIIFVLIILSTFCTI